MIKPTQNNIDVSSEPEVKLPINNSKLNYNQCINFIIHWEGSVKDSEGNHILYDDDVTVVKKRKWDGKGGIEGIKRFIKSCKGKPTIGYGETSKDIIIKGKLTDSEAKSLLLRKIISINNYLVDNFDYFGNLNNNQKIALISFSYNLGKDFIKYKTKKLKYYLENGKFDKISHEMLDCNNITQNR